jgi:CRP/FNR family transcriptional regulator, cyclic AMP receptor protein
VTAIALLDADPDLADAIDEAERIRARTALVAPSMEVEAGPWEPEPLADGGVGLLVIEGALLREVTAGDVGAMELLGPGDVLVPQPDEAVADFVEAAVQWFALLPTQFAVLDAEVVQRLSQWPGILATVIRRMAERSARQAVVQAICHNPRVDVRLRELFWHLAERWGRVTAGGVVLPLRLTHEALARLVGAQRPTVSTALKGLHDTGEVTRRGDGAWVLLPENPERLKGLHRRVGNRHAAIAVIHDGNGDGDGLPMVEQLDRLRIAWEQQSASVMLLRQRMAALRSETKGLTGELRQFRENRNHQDGSSGS